MQNMESSMTKTSRAKRAGTISFNFDTMKWDGLMVSQIEVWQRLYPHISIMQEVTESIPRWLDKNKENKKAHKRAWRKFIVNWLKRENQRRSYQ
jgi:hypothetical protein